MLDTVWQYFGKKMKYALAHDIDKDMKQTLTGEITIQCDKHWVLLLIWHLGVKDILGKGMPKMALERQLIRISKVKRNPYKKCEL